MFVSVDGKAKEVKELFVGGSDGLAHKVNEAFGSVDGIAKLIYNGTPREPNGFDQFTWAEIKELADNGLLLNYFKRFDRVDIKLTQPLIGYDIYDTTPTWYQDMLPMVISEICETGMRLVAHIVTPYIFGAGFQELYGSHFVKDVGRLVGTTEKWGMCPTLYKGCKAVDDALPTDMREVLHDFSPLYKYEYYTDEEGKKRLLEEYDDCRVRQITSNGYSYHREYVEERDREEYILDTSYFARTETGFKKYMPPDDWKHSIDQCYGLKSVIRKVETTVYDEQWVWTLMWQDPDIGWKWDWEDYWGTNEHSAINHPIYKPSSPGYSYVCPEVQIGTIAETLNDLE